MQIKYSGRSINFLGLIIIILLGISACKSSLPVPKDSDKVIVPPALSAVNTSFVLNKQSLDLLMNSQVPIELLKMENESFGNGLEGDLLLKRNGMITWVAIDSNRIQITAPVQVSGKVGLDKSGFGSLIKGKIPFDEQLNPTFLIKPKINEDWSVGLEEFQILDLGGQLELNVLGMEVELTGVLQQQIQKMADSNLANSPNLINLKPMIDLAWQQAGRPIAVQWQGIARGFSFQPDEARLSHFFDSNGDMNISLGVDGKINSHPANAIPSRAFPLPSLTENTETEEFLNITLPLALKYEELNLLLQQYIGNRVYKVDKKTTFVPSNFRAEPYGQLVGIRMDFLAEKANGKEIDGEIFLVGRPVYDDESGNLVFRDIDFAIDSDSFQAQAGAGLKRNKIKKQIEKQAQFPLESFISESIQGIKDRLQLRTPLVTIGIQDLEVRPNGFYPKETELLIHFEAEGKVEVTSSIQ